MTVSNSKDSSGGKFLLPACLQLGSVTNGFYAIIFTMRRKFPAGNLSINTNLNPVTSFPINTNRVPDQKSSSFAERIEAAYDEAAKIKPTTNDINNAVTKLTTALREKGFPTNGVIKIENGIILVSADTKLTRDDMLICMYTANININWDHQGRFFPDLKLGSVTNGIYSFNIIMRPGPALNLIMKTNQQFHLK